MARRRGQEVARALDDRGGGRDGARVVAPAADVGLLDPCSSGPGFTGWTHALDPPGEASPVEPARTWVLRDGWITRGGGRIRLGEVPRALRR